MSEQTQSKSTRSAWSGLERAAMISTVLIWLGVVLAGIGLYVAYRNHRQQTTARAQATAIAATAEHKGLYTERTAVSTPTSTPTPTSTFTPEVFPQGWQTATPQPALTDIYNRSGKVELNGTPVLSTRAVSSSPTPSPTPTVLPLPPERIVIPKINLDESIVPISWHTITENDQQSIVWQVADNKVGWHRTSALLGQQGNLVLNGHHNIKAQVFQHLVELEIGDTVALYAGDQAFYYVVTEKHILKEKDEPIEVRRKNAEWIGPTEDQRLTMVTCWPYTSNTHRLVVVARPATTAEIEGLLAE